MSKLSAEAIEQKLAALDGWNLQGDAIAKQFVFPSFPDAVAFAVRLAFEAEAADHHPDIRISYRKVTLTYSTHSARGITEKDFDGARMAERCL